MNLSCRSALVALSIGTLGCHDAFAPTSSTEVGPNLVRLTVSASASDVPRGLPTTIRATVANDGSESVTLHFRDSCQINPYVRNAAGEIVLPAGGGWGCAAMLTDLTLPPGKSVTREFIWTGSDSFGTEMPLRSLPAGKYLFSVEVPASEGALRATVGITLE